ncbi:hypothetical protein NU08_3344 [Flavobacterium anhuiense]|uniref:Uncharacterized protein n=1 Tax=Flavobacterium anhuiense TaxID=459526 RepID=A0A444VVP4_9FLAO|nr:hypothetical protein NU08_3344 [Flavobacterium anhuiense]
MPFYVKQQNFKKEKSNFFLEKAFSGTCLIGTGNCYKILPVSIGLSSS